MLMRLKQDKTVSDCFSVLFVLFQNVRRAALRTPSAILDCIIRLLKVKLCYVERISVLY